MYYKSNKEKNINYHKENKNISLLIIPIFFILVMIEAFWTPNMTIYTKKINLNKLSYEKMELIEKAATLDNNEMYSEAVQIKGKEISNLLKEALIQLIRVNIF